MKTNSFNWLSNQVKKYPILFYGVSILVYLVFFFAFIGIISNDYTIFLEPWSRLIKENGFLILKEDFYNYAPSYMYLLALTTLIPVKPVITIKLFSLPVIPLGGYYMTRLAARFNLKPVLSWLGFTLTLLAPTILLNSALYYGVAGLACVVYFLYQKPYPAMLALGLALAVKFQIIFLGPFLLIMLNRKQIPWKRNFYF
jgi:Gpi18-like mannosyltransferase